MIGKQRVLARAKTWDFGITDKGNEQFAILFELLEGPNQGQTITWYGFFVQGTNKDGKPYDMAKQTIEVMRICGWDGDDLTDTVGLDRNDVQLVIDHESYEGKTSAKVKFVNRPGGLGIKNKLPENSRAALAKKFKGLAMSVPKVTPTEKPMREMGDDSYDEDFGGL